MEFTGKLTHKTDIVEVGQNKTLKASIIVEEVGTEYPSSIVADVFGDKTEYLRNYKVGDMLIVKLNSRASEYNGKRYGNLSAWNIKKADKEETVEETPDESLPF